MEKNSYSDISIEKSRIFSFFAEMDDYFKNRFKDEPVHEIISEGLKIFFNTKEVQLAAFLSVEPQTFTFKLSVTEPKEEFARAQVIYNTLLEEGVISNILSSGKSNFFESENKLSYNLVIPLSDPSGIQGMIIIEVKGQDFDLLLYEKVFNHQANQITLFLSNNKLNKKLKSVNTLLEQKLAFRTESIKQKQRELQIILDSINTGVFIIEKNSFEIIDVNYMALEMLGFDKQLVIGKNRKQFSPHWNYQIEDMPGNNLAGEVELFNNSSTTIPVLNSIKIINLNGQEYLLESFIDISRIKNVENELRNSEYRFRIIFENASFGMVLTDEDLRIVEGNNAFRKMVGCTIMELKYKKINDYIYRDDMIIFNKYFSSGVLINKNNEIRFIDSYNDLIWCKITGTVLRYSIDSVYYKLFMIEDISSIVSSKDALFKQTNLLMGVADATNALLTLSDYEKAIAQAIESLGKASEVDRVYIAKNSSIGIGEDTIIELAYEWHSENYTNGNKSEFPADFSYAHYFPGWYDDLSDGRTIHGYIGQSAIPGMRYFESDDVKSMIIVPIFVDLSFWGFIGFDDRKKEKIWSEVEESILKATAAGIGGAIKIVESQRELLKAKDKAEKSDQLKTEFLAQMSHEIRTPINSILSFSGLIREEVQPQLSAEYQACFNAISSAGERIIRTVDMILNMSDLQSGGYEINPFEYELYNSVFENLADEFSHKANEKGIEFVVRKPEFSTWIKADEYTVSQIFVNLIDNALKYTSEGKVEILFEEENPSGFKAKIIDTGIGISEEFFPRLFEPFAQEEQGYTRRYEGNGLGLALVKKYCDLSKVEINVESSKGVGTTFSLLFKRSMNNLH